MLSGSLIATNLMQDALCGRPQLLFRGCMAAGRLREDVDFLIGPAVDEAAERFEKADGPFFWMSPSALDISARYADTFQDRIEPVLLTDYTIPLNNGEETRTCVFNYFGLVHDDGWRRATRVQLLSAFGDEISSVNVQRKRQNAINFLDHIERMAQIGEWRHKLKPYRSPNWEDLSYGQKINSLVNDMKRQQGELRSKPTFADV